MSVEYERVYDASNNEIQYTYTSYITTVDNIQTTVNILTDMSFNYVVGENTVATLPYFITEIAENFADASVIGSESLQYITELIIGENVNHFRKGICRNWTRLTHLTLNMQTGPTVDVDYGSFINSSNYNTIVYEIPTSFQNSAMNTITMFSNDFSRNILLLLVGDVTDNIRTLNIIDGSLSITGIIQGLNRTPRGQTEYATSGSQDILLTSISIPNSVTSIGGSGFTRCIALTSISMPQVTSIGDYVFNDCTALTSVSMPLVQSIGTSAFIGCSINIQSLQQLYYQGFLDVKTNPNYGLYPLIRNNIRPYSITGTTITSIFLHVSDYYYITIPDTITAIAENAATGATFLTALTIPSSVIFIGANAFSQCSNLVTVVLPGSNGSGYSTLVQDAFSGTNISQSSLQAMRNQGYAEETLRVAGFTDVPVAAITYNLSPDSTVLNSITVLPGGVNFALINIPSSVTSINASAVIINTFLTSLTIPDTVTTIGANAFSGCSNLVTLVLPTSPLVALGPNAFFETTNVNTSSLQDINLQGYSATNLRVAGFTATQLKAAGFDMTQLQAAGFTDSELQAAGFTIDSTPVTETRVDTGNSQIVYTFTTTVTTVNTIQTTVNILTDMSFNYDYTPGATNITVATLPNFITEIAENFADGDLIPSLKNITELIIGANVSHYRMGICKNWTSLTHLTLNQNISTTVDVESIQVLSTFGSPAGSYIVSGNFQNSAINTVSMFSNEYSRNLVSFLLCDIIPNIKTLNIIEPSSSITDIVRGFEKLPQTALEFLNYEGGLFHYIPFLTSVSIPSSVTSIGPHAFFKSTALTSMYMPQVRSIGNNAFQICTALTSVDMPQVTSIGDSAFMFCAALISVHMPEVRSIDANAFFGGDSDGLLLLTSINMPQVTSIGSSAFIRCRSLTSVSMPRITSIGSNAFLNCPINIQSLQQLYYQGFLEVKTNISYGFNTVTQSQIKTYGISDTTITSIFLHDSDSYYITIPDTITAIAASAATGAIFLTALTIPYSVTTIGANAFSGCSNLVTLVLPTSPLVTLGPNAFFETTNVNTASLQDINLQGYSATNLRVAGFTATQLKAAGFTASQLKTALFTATELRVATYTIADLKLDTNNAYSDADILAAGYSASELQAAGLYTPPVTPPVTPVPCFNEDSKILCLVDGQEKEVLVQNLRSGVLVKTFYSGYKPVCMIGTSVLYNPGTNERFNDRLFICKKEKYPELNEDLIITGCHSILVDEITPLQREKIIKQMGAIYETENNYRLNAILDERAEPYNCAGNFNIYHIALEHDNYIANYGVYANGLLVETCSKRYLKEMSKMRLL